jgi:putative ABC transport system substrate-binding protein
MRRRDFVRAFGAATIAWPSGARSQQAKPVIGFLGSESPPLSATYLRIFREALREAGYVEGENVVIKYVWAEGHNDRLPGLAADLISQNVNVIVAPASTPAPLAAKKLTTKIPIVFFTGGDPVALGLVQSLNRPGTNATGTTSLAAELAPKRLELLHELMPTAKTTGLLINTTNPTLMTSITNAVRNAASVLGIEVRVVPVTAEADFEGAFAKFVELRVTPVVIAIDSYFTARREILGKLALQNGIAAIYQFRDFSEAGGVMSYGGSLRNALRIVGLYTARILNGENPGELPVQQSTNVELVVNLKSASSLGIKVPQTLLARADEVIE